MSDMQAGQSASRLAMQAGHANAICYSGYREGQSPHAGIFPTYDNVCEDLHILAHNWKFLRLYDCSPHAETVLEVIHREALDLKVMIGLDAAAEMSNWNCPWGAEYSEEILTANRESNSQQVEKLIALAKAYPDIVSCVSVGNEATVEWTDHMVPVESLINYVHRIKDAISQPVTFCENYVPWTSKLEPLAVELDFISVHTYPAWEYRTIEDALEYTKQNYHDVMHHFPGKQIVITEAGWTTTSNGRGLDSWNASEELQAIYYHQLIEWTTKEKILTFFFEAFDEPWKGSSDPLDPEKHWGLFTVDRRPKLAMREIPRYAEIS